tara:strand:+ start:407 stop:823 length:417 start_codon:yes stop_codon:yes gene_type:complete
MMTANANAGPLSKKRLATAATARQKAKESVRLVREPVEVTVFGALVLVKSPHKKRTATAKTTTATEKSMMTVSVSAGLPSQRRLVTVVPKRPNQKDNVALDNEHVFLTARGAVVKARSSHNKKSVMGKITTATAKSMS